MKLIKISDLHYNLPIYLLLLFPLFFILGPAIVEIASFLLIIFFFKNTNINFYKKNHFYIYIFLAFYLYIFVRSLFFSLDFEKIRSIFFYFRFLFFSCAIIFFANRINSKNKYCIKIIFFILLALILDAIFQYYYGKNIFGIRLNDPFRPSSFFGSELILGSFLFRILPFIFIVLLLFKYNFKNNTFKLSIFFSLYFFTVLISGERTSFFLLLVMIFLLLILNKTLRKTLLFSLVIFIFMSFFASFYQKNPFDRMFKETLNKFSKETNVVDKLYNNNLLIKKNNYYFFSKEHHGHYLVAFRMFLDNPIFGQGPRSFRYLCSEEVFLKNDGICTTHPHNTYLQLLAETGLVGFIFIFILFCSTLKVILNKIINNFFYNYSDNKYVEIKYISLIAIFVSLFPFVPSGNFFNNWLSFMYYYPLAFYIYSINKIKC
jgi:O-antigen ligase